MSPSSVAWTPVRSFGAAAVDRPLHLLIPSKANNEHRESFAAPRNLQFVYHYPKTLIYTDEPLEYCLGAGAQLWSGRSRLPLHLVIPSKANNEHRESFAAPRNLQFVHHDSKTLIYTDEPLEYWLEARRTAL